MRIIHLIAVSITFGGMIAPFVAVADPPPWAGVYKDKHKHKHHHHDDDRVVYVPVPVAPVRPVARLPYGFARGTCDRGLISSEFLGGALGGVAGGVGGSRFGQGQGKTAATIGGTLLGVMLGSSIGRSMDMADQGCVLAGLEHLPDQRAIAWDGADGTPYRVTPVRSWESAPGRYCREYQATAQVGGRSQRIYGTACRQPDGSWEIVD